jgi:hypothetical protein
MKDGRIIDSQMRGDFLALNRPSLAKSLFTTQLTLAQFYSGQ